MDTEPKISAKQTYVLDEDEIDRLDELSLTSVIADASGSLDQPQDGSGSGSPEPAASGSQGDTTINEILKGSLPPGAPQSETSADAQSGANKTSTDSADDLIAPELLFPELSLRK